MCVCVCVCVATVLVPVSANVYMLAVFMLCNGIAMGAQDSGESSGWEKFNTIQQVVCVHWGLSKGFS